MFCICTGEKKIRLQLIGEFVTCKMINIFTNLAPWFTAFPPDTEIRRSECQLCG